MLLEGTPVLHKVFEYLTFLIKVNCNQSSVGKCMNQNQTDSTNGWNFNSDSLDCGNGPLLSSPRNDNVQTKMHSDNSITFALGSGAPRTEL